jgi:hypothetical protein
MTPTHARLLVAALAAVALLTPNLSAQTNGHPALDDGHRLFYNGRYDAAVALALPMCTSTPLDLDACELTTAALHFQLRRALDSGAKPKKWATCLECPALMSTFLAVTTRSQTTARTMLEANPADDETRFLLGKINLNFVWLQLATIGKKTGWKEYWEARNLLDEVIGRNPGMIRALVARAWIDYIVDTRMPRGTKWLLGGGNRKRGLLVVHEAANTPADFFVATEATFALWDMQVRERQFPAAVATAKRLARDFPDNQELVKFLTTHETQARQ